MMKRNVASFGRYTAKKCETLKYAGYYMHRAKGPLSLLLCTIQLYG